MIWRKKPVGLGLIGCGNMGRQHAQMVQANKRSRLLWTFDSERERAEKVARACSGRHVAERLEQLLEDPEVEGVIIATPHRLHHAQTLQALAAGKNVLVEKPMALDAAQSLEMVSQARQAGRRLLVGQVMRFWPNVNRARDAIQAGRIGQIHHVMRTRLVYQRDAGRAWAHNPAEAGGWLIHGITVHEVDALLYMTGLKIARVQAVAVQNNPTWKDVDELSALLQFEGGAAGALSHSLNCHTSSLETVIIGSLGSIRLDQYNRGYRENEAQSILPEIDGVADQLQEFIRVVRDNIPSRIDAKHILPTMPVLDALRGSLQTELSVAVQSAEDGEVICHTPGERRLRA